MHQRLLFSITFVAALLALLLLPWLAFREAQRQAYDATSELTLSYARDILHRADGTAQQALDAIAQLKKATPPVLQPRATHEHRLLHRWT